MKAFSLVTGEEIELGQVVLAQDKQPIYWRLTTASGSILCLSAQHYVLELPAVNTVAKQEEATYEVAPPMPIIENKEKEVLGNDLGECSSLPPTSGVGDVIYHTIDKKSYRFTIDGWIPIPVELPSIKDEVREVKEAKESLKSKASSKRK